MKYTMDDFEPMDAWLAFRMNVVVRDGSAGVYFLLDVASNYIFGNVMTEDELPDSTEIDALLDNAFSTKNSWPKKFLFPEDDPAEEIFMKWSEESGVPFELASLEDLENIIRPIKESFSQFSF